MRWKVVFTNQLLLGGPYTLFAPTNDAFKILTDDGTLTKLMASPSDLKRLLLGHVVAGSYFLPSLVNGLEIRALDGDINAIRVERMTGSNMNMIP